MKTIDNDTKQYYLTRMELQAMTFGSNKNPKTGNYSWIEKFDEGDILHIKEHNGSTTIMQVQVVKQLNHFM